MKGHNLGKFKTDLTELEERARKVRDEEPSQFSVRKLAVKLHCSNNHSSRVYYKILKGI